MLHSFMLDLDSTAKARGPDDSEFNILGQSIIVRILDVFRKNRQHRQPVLICSVNELPEERTYPAIS